MSPTRQILPLLLLLTLGAASPTPAKAAKPGAAQLRVLWTANTGGVSASRGRGPTFSVLHRALTQRHGRMQIEAAGAAVFRRPGEMIVSSDLRAGTVRRLLGRIDQLPLVRTYARLPILVSRSDLLLQVPPDPLLDLIKLALDEKRARQRDDPTLRRTTARVEVRDAGAGRQILVIHTAGSPARRPADPRAWELWWSVGGSARLAQRRARFFGVLKKLGGGARRAQKIDDLRRGAGAPPTLLLSAGNDVRRFAYTQRKGGGTTHDPLRTLDFATLGRLRYDALAPGLTELYWGAGPLLAAAKKHELPLTAANLRYRSGKHKGKAVLPRYLLRTVGGRRVAIIGVVDPALHQHVSNAALLADVEVTDPVKATSRVLEELFAMPGGRPALVIALGSLLPATYARFRQKTYGVDLLLGDASRSGLHVPPQRVEVPRPRERLVSRSVLLAPQVSYLHVGRLVAAFGAEATTPLRRLSLDGVLIDAAIPPDPSLQRQLTNEQLDNLRDLEARVMPSLERVLKGAPELRKRAAADPMFSTTMTPRQIAEMELWYTPRMWAQIVANILREATGAEVVLVPRRSTLGTNVPGPVREDYVRNWLSRDEPLATLELSGKQLRRLVTLLQASDKAYALSGLDIEGMLVGGRPLTDKERYRVALVKKLLSWKPVARVIRGAARASLEERFVERRGQLLANKQRGTPRGIARVVLARLRAERRGGDPEQDGRYADLVRRWLEPQGREVAPRWSIAAEGLTLSFANYANYPGRSWLRNSGVRETRAVTPSNYTLGVRGALALTYDSPALTWETRGTIKLARTVIDLSQVGNDEVEQESADDLLASTELRLKLIQLALGESRRFKLVPYASGTFDSEFTPTLNPLTQEAFPHQKELRLAAGLRAAPGQILREVRLAALLKSDFSAPKGEVEGGLLASLKLAFPIWRARLELGATLRYFVPTDEDTVEDLGLIIEGVTRLVVPFTRDLSVSLFADYFIYRPKVAKAIDVGTGTEVERTTAASLILGAGVSFDHLWKW